MLHDLSIKNYRVFEDFYLDNIAQVNLVVGANNSGKSSLLEAIYLLTSEDVLSGLAYILDERGEFVSMPPEFSPGSDRQTATYGYQIGHIFHGRGFKGEQEKAIQVRSGKNYTLILGNLSPIKPNLDNKITDESELRFVHVKPGVKPKIAPLPLTDHGLWPRRPYSRRDPGLNAKLVTTNYLPYDELALLWDTITLTPREDKVVEALQILEPRVQRISFTSRKTLNSGILLRMAGEVEPIPLGSMGDGMRRILAIAASLVSVENGTLLVDEIDTGLYYGVLVDMWRLVFETALKRNVQVFATTHSWDCVKAFQQALRGFSDPELGQLIRLEGQNGAIKAVLYSKEELKIAIEQEIEVR